MFKQIHDLIHQLEASLAIAMNDSDNPKVKHALEHAHDSLVHQVAEWVRTAETRK